MSEKKEEIMLLSKDKHRIPFRSKHKTFKQNCLPEYIRMLSACLFSVCVPGHYTGSYFSFFVFVVDAVVVYLDVVALVTCQVANMKLYSLNQPLLQPFVCVGGILHKARAESTSE